MYITLAKGGDFTSRDGNGQMSIYSGLFEDENFLIPHDSPGTCSFKSAHFKLRNPFYGQSKIEISDNFIILKHNRVLRHCLKNMFKSLKVMIFFVRWINAGKTRDSIKIDHFYWICSIKFNNSPHAEVDHRTLKPTGLTLVLQSMKLPWSGKDVGDDLYSKTRRVHYANCQSKLYSCSSKYTVLILLYIFTYSTSK